jgi:hypothetical protein
MDLETGTIVPLKEAKDVKGAIEFYSPTAAGFSPDGKRVLFTYQDAKRAGRLVVRDIENRDEYLLLDQTSETNLLWYSLPNQRIYWGENNRVLVGNGQRTGLVLTLGAK